MSRTKIDSIVVEKKMIRRFGIFLVFWVTLVACIPLSNNMPLVVAYSSTPKVQAITPSLRPILADPTNTPSPTSMQAESTITPTLPIIVSSANGIPNFDHIILIVLENRGYSEVIGNSEMPFFNALAQQNVILDQYYAVTHPSLPNYIALVSGSTQGITRNCRDCFVDQSNLADLIEDSGRTWKTYQEDMPSSCYLGDAKPYAQKHNPLIYFDSIRLDPTRCNRGIVPLTQLKDDLDTRQLPNFALIVPNLCNSGHDCSDKTTDGWVNEIVLHIQESNVLGENSLIIITYDEAGDEDTTSCCGLDTEAGGHIATVLISPMAKPGLKDNHAYSHYSLLKTILTAWNLPALGQTAQNSTQAIQFPWINQVSLLTPNLPGQPSILYLADTKVLMIGAEMLLP